MASDQFKRRVEASLAPIVNILEELEAEMRACAALLAEQEKNEHGPQA